MKPEVEVILMETQLPMALSTTENAVDGYGLSNESRGTWGDLWSE